MKLTINISLNNDTMQAPVDAAVSIQRSLYTSPPADPFAEGQHGKILDGNGNTVGIWHVTEQTTWQE